MSKVVSRDGIATGSRGATVATGPQLAYTVPDAAAPLGIGVSSLYADAQEGPDHVHDHRRPARRSPRRAERVLAAAEAGDPAHRSGRMHGSSVRPRRKDRQGLTRLPDSPAARIVKALGGRNGRANCPLKDHSTPLSLSVRDGKTTAVVVDCHAGCSSLDVLRELRRRGLLEDVRRPATRGFRPGDKPLRPIRRRV